MTARDIIEKAWSWKGLAPDAVLDTNSFGNVVVRARDGKVWRICPEELSCEIIAESEERFRQLWQSPEFQADWRMDRLVQLAEHQLGSLSGGRCYCLKLPAVLGGTYEASNLGTNTVTELLAFAGDIAEQINDLPEGAEVNLVVK